LILLIYRFVHFFVCPRNSTKEFCDLGEAKGTKEKAAVKMEVNSVACIMPPHQKYRSPFLKLYEAEVRNLKYRG
jgi:hypothetical protein